MKLRFLPLVFLTALGLSAAAAPKKIVMIAGLKSHGTGDHEYEKGLLLLKGCLDQSAPGVETEVYFNGWPRDPKVLETADTVVLYCDGSDRDEKADPLLQGDRLDQLGRAMKRGAGLVAIHYAVFVPSQKAGSQFLDWLGGYFDYENGTAANKWYSTIQTRDYPVHPATPGHPITRGVEPFTVKEEYYFQIRFRPNDPGWKPVLSFGDNAASVVGWSIERPDGGRGFGYTGGHFHSNWQNENVRRMVLNAILWTARADVPEGGVKSSLPQEKSATGKKALILTGYNGPFHDWRKTTVALKELLEPQFAVTVVEDPEYLATQEWRHYDLLVQNYVNWDRPTITNPARSNLLTFVQEGKGIALIHFANGAFRDWPDYPKLSRRLWVDGKATHDAFGLFHVDVRPVDHPILRGIKPFDTIDELYCNQVGDEPVEALVTAHSKVSNKDEPLAWAHPFGKGRVFQTLLGHDAESIRKAGTLILNGSRWAAGLE